MQLLHTTKLISFTAISLLLHHLEILPAGLSFITIGFVYFFKQILSVFKQVFLIELWMKTVCTCARSKGVLIWNNVLLFSSLQCIETIMQFCGAFVLGKWICIAFVSHREATIITSFFSCILLLTSKLWNEVDVTHPIGVRCWVLFQRTFETVTQMNASSHDFRMKKETKTFVVAFSDYTFLLFIEHVRAYVTSFTIRYELLLLSYNFNFWSNLYPYVLETHQICTVYLSFDKFF